MKNVRTAPLYPILEMEFSEMFVLLQLDYDVSVIRMLYLFCFNKT